MNIFSFLYKKITGKNRKKEYFPKVTQRLLINKKDDKYYIDAWSGSAEFMQDGKFLGSVRITAEQYYLLRSFGVDDWDRVSHIYSLD